MTHDELLGALEAEIARWQDQGHGYSAMRWHPQCKWFNGQGDALQWCAKRIRELLDSSIHTHTEPAIPVDECRRCTELERRVMRRR